MERPLSAPPVGKATRVLDQALVLEMSGEAEAAEVREVALRNMTIAAVDVTSMTTQPWPRLEAVSLSQNPLGSGESAAQLWAWLSQCDSLRCLNLNFCELESLEGIQSLVGLEQLYMSTNRITDLSPLKSCRQLRTLTMHRNALEDLDGCMATLGALPQLSDLDLSGNPIWFRPECKHRCVSELAALRRYDDEEVTELDRELAAESTAGDMGPGSPAHRPSTAPATSGRLSVPFRLPVAQTASPTVPSPPPGGRDSPTHPERGSDVNVIGLGSTGGSFVQRLRKSTAILSAPVTNVPCAASVPSLEECLTDPTRGVHTLYAIVQELNTKLAEDRSLQQRPGSAAADAVRSKPPTDVVKALERENGLLKLENSNMYFLKKENDELKAELQQQQQRREQQHGSTAVVHPGSSAEVERLKSELDVLRQNYLVLLQGSGQQERPKTAAEVIESCEAEYDSDLAELFRRNERGLAECRQALSLAKAELGGGAAEMVGDGTVPAAVALAGGKVEARASPGVLPPHGTRNSALTAPTVNPARLAV